MRCPAVLAGLIGSILLTLPGMGQPTATLDEQILLAAKLSASDADLIEFLRLRSHRTDDAALLKKLVEQLGSNSHKDRENADWQLLLRGPVAVPYLKAALKTGSTEVVRRAEILIKNIESMGPEVPVAAVRLLALRQTPGAVETLLGYLSAAPDDWVEAEVVASLGQLAIRAGKVDARLQAALGNSYSHRRGAAAYLLGQRADVEQRSAVRKLLDDADPLVRERAALGLAGKRWPQTLRETAVQDDEVLKKNFGTADNAALLAFLQKRTLSDSDQQRLQRLIADLGHRKFSVRNEASRLLVKEGTPALAFLKLAEMSPDAEVVRRARLCSEEIRSGPGPALPIAVVHRLASAKESTPPAEIIRVLIGYVPFADDETVGEEVSNALTVLSTRSAAIDPLLPAALADPLPARRGAAALVLGRVGTKEHVPALRKLLDDPAALVRFRAADGLLAAKDAVCVPRLIALLMDLPPQHAAQAEDRLQRLAGEQAPSIAVGDGSAAVRAKAVRAWEQWWHAHASTLDLTVAGAGEAFLGLVTVCEYDSANGMPAGQVWETARAGPPRWKVSGFLGAMDAHYLPSGNVLVAENSANRVSERDKNGAVKWEHRVQANPVACQRLPNGNTFIASYHQLTEVDAQGKRVYDRNRGAGAFIFGAHRARNGHVVYVTGQGTLVEYDPVADKELRSINIGANGGWSGVEMLPSGRYLVATMNNSLVREIDAQGKSHWQASYAGVFRASRMPNGHTLVASMTTKKIAELDRNGQIRWEKTCEGRPWSVHWR